MTEQWRAAEASGGGAQPSDLALLRGVAAGEEESFRLLFRRWAPRLGRFLTQIAGSRETAEDLLQEAFLRILRAAPRFEPRGAVSAWMYRICANLAYSHWRRRRASPVLALWEADLPPEPAAPSSADPGRARDRRAFAEAARAALWQIPENQRLVFLLKVDQGLTYEQIAGVLHCPVGTTKSRFHHAVRKLRTLLGDWGDDTAEDRSGELAEDPLRNTRAERRKDDVL